MNESILAYIKTQGVLESEGRTFIFVRLPPCSRGPFVLPRVRPNALPESLFTNHFELPQDSLQIFSSPHSWLLRHNRRPINTLVKCVIGTCVLVSLALLRIWKSRSTMEPNSLTAGAIELHERAKQLSYSVEGIDNHLSKASRSLIAVERHDKDSGDWIEPKNRFLWVKGRTVSANTPLPNEKVVQSQIIQRSHGH